MALRRRRQRRDLASPRPRTAARLAARRVGAHPARRRRRSRRATAAPGPPGRVQRSPTPARSNRRGRQRLAGHRAGRRDGGRRGPGSLGRPAVWRLVGAATDARPARTRPGRGNGGPAAARLAGGNGRRHGRVCRCGPSRPRARGSVRRTLTRRSRCGAAGHFVRRLPGPARPIRFRRFPVHPGGPGRAARRARNGSNRPGPRVGERRHGHVVACPSAAHHRGDAGSGLAKRQAVGMAVAAPGRGRVPVRCGASRHQVGPPRVGRRQDDLHRGGAARRRAGRRGARPSRPDHGLPH